MGSHHATQIKRISTQWGLVTRVHVETGQMQDAYEALARRVRAVCERLATVPGVSTGGPSGELLAGLLVLRQEVLLELGELDLARVVRVEFSHHLLHRLPIG